MKHIEFSSEFVTGNPQSIVLLGVHPQQPEGEYGWIVTGENIFYNNMKRVNAISRFVEKPDAFSASRLYHQGGLWNTMVIVSKAKTLLTLFKVFTPTVYHAFWEIRDALGSSLEPHVIEKVYLSLSPMNFSYSILEKNPAGLCTVGVQGVYWSDWGNAARIQSDILRFCAVKETLMVPLPYAKMFDATVYALNNY